MDYKKYILLFLTCVLCTGLFGSQILRVSASGTTTSGATSSGAISSSGLDPYILLSPNGGKGEEVKVEIPDGADQIQLPVNQFTRYGYVFRGWITDPDGKVCEFEDKATIKDLQNTIASASATAAKSATAAASATAADVETAVSSTTAATAAPPALTLYALWEPQMYILRYIGNGEEYGLMPDHYAVYDHPAKLDACMYSHTGRKFLGWHDSMGRTYRNMQEFMNLHSGNTYSRKVLTVDAGLPLNENYTFRSTQGSVVFEENGRQYLITAASINDDSYYDGDLSHYETILTKYDLATGEAVKTVRNLPFDHGNGICRSDENWHIYIAEGGTLSQYPSGVMELDADLNFVQEWNFPLLTNIWAIAYADHHFYMIGRNKESRNSICVLNDEMQTLSINEVDEYYSQNFSSQGIAADDYFVYAISAGFQAYEWKTKQRINVFTHEGEYLGVWTIDIPYEAEDITVIGEYAYISTNEKAKSTLYRTRIPAVDLYAIWK